MYSFMSKQINEPYKEKTLKENYEKILICMNPIIPHFSSECLEMINSKETIWPNYDEKLLEEDFINIVVQINGKKRGLIKTEKNISEIDVLKNIEKEKNIMKFLSEKHIKKKIYIKNKLINIII